MAMKLTMQATELQGSMQGCHNLDTPYRLTSCSYTTTSPALQVSPSEPPFAAAATFATMTTQETIQGRIYVQNLEWPYVFPTRLPTWLFTLLTRSTFAMQNIQNVKAGPSELRDAAWKQLFSSATADALFA
jgi:hypothetical protein